MKKIIALLLLLTTALTITHAQKKRTAPGKLLRHIVLFKFKDDAAEADIKKVETAFRMLPSKIAQIAAFEWGTNNSPENLNQGFTHSFFVSFKNEEDRKTYLSHPDHLAFVDILKPQLDKVLVIDYWAGR
jgi:Stress responsive A/B Barrel Domain